MHKVDLPVRGNPSSKQSPMLHHVSIFSHILSFTCRSVWARDPLFGTEIPSPGSFSAVLLIHPSGGPPRAFLLCLFWKFQLHGTSFSPLLPLITTLSLFESCVCLGKASSSSPITFLHCLSHFSSSQVPHP